MISYEKFSGGLKVDLQGERVPAASLWGRFGQAWRIIRNKPIIAQTDSLIITNETT